MKSVISTEKIPIKLWLDINDVEEKALQQAKNLANLPFAFKHVAAMPGIHLGYGMPIETILATKNVIIPNAVGVDIGCGMVASTSQFVESMPSDAKLLKVMSRIRELIPLGFKHREKVFEKNTLHELANRIEPNLFPVLNKQDEDTVLKQAGTLGSGNHFIEIQQDQEGYLFIMIHSGSRNIGKRVAEYHNKVAKKLNERWHTSVPASHDLAFLPIESMEAHQYQNEMEWCVDFAKESRLIMINIVRSIMSQELTIPFCDSIDVAHNYARFENHFGENVIVHRKGATSAKRDETVIIPGSQGTNSYIGFGLGNKDSFNSCSHGAGRKMSRTKAKKELNLEQEQRAMNEKGILHGMRNKSDLDEASSAYKDIDEVMENQLDLVKVEYKLTPKAVIKG